MSALDAAHAANIVDASLGTAAFVATTTPLKVRLMSANGSSTANGTEVANAGGSTYAAQTAAFNAASTSTGQATSSGALTYANMPATTVTGVEPWDSAGTPKRKWWGALSVNKTTNLGDTFSIASASLTATDL